MLPRKKKSLGQHFLHDQNILRKIVELIAPNP
ncbi:MAG TPA: ribosomal RNA small subunit methyltransferase A, partial [Coxiellaceae bacterium]|nr:ribosomal RNA small subunit methyltransferase A [Coxiellaceae bacterium]